MAARQVHDTPREQLLALAFRARVRGLTFDEFWNEAVRPGQPPITRRHADPPATCVVWPSDTTDRNAERAATAESKDGWRRAYERQPALRCEAAVARLGGLLAHFSDSSHELPDPGRAVAA